LHHLRLEERLSVFAQADDDESGGERLDRVHFEGLAVVDRVGRDNERQLPVVSVLAQRREWDLVEAVPGAVDRAEAVVDDQLQVSRREHLGGLARQDDAIERLADFEGADEPHAHGL